MSPLEIPSLAHMANALAGQLGILCLKMIPAVLTYLGLEGGHIMEQDRIALALLSFNNDEPYEPSASPKRG